MNTTANFHQTLYMAETVVKLNGKPFTLSRVALIEEIILVEGRPSK